MGLLLSNALMRIFNMLNIDKNDHCHAGTLTLWGIKKKKSWYEVSANFLVKCTPVTRDGKH